MTAPTLHRDASEFRLLHTASLMALFCVGMYAGAFGPVLPFLAEDLGVSLDTAGLVLTALFFGSIAASSTVALALHGRDTRALSAAGLGCATAGLLVLGLAPWWPLALFGAVVLGAGDGLIIAALHILMAATSRDVPRAINTLNLWFAVGAVGGPLWAGAMLSWNGQRAIVFGGMAGIVALSFVTMLAAGGIAHREVAAPDGKFRLPGNPTAWIMGALLFLYVGAEFGLGAWVSTYAREAADASVMEGAALSAGYWGALLCGRVISGLYFGRGRDSSALLAVAVAGAGLSSLLLALADGSIALSAVGAFGAGLALGPVWPATLAIASEGNSADATATTVTIGNAGGLAIPWLQGKVLVGAGASEGVAVTALLCAAMFVIIIAFRFRRRA